MPCGGALSCWADPCPCVQAYPFSNGPDEAVNKMADQLFRVVHLGTFSTRIQALTLLFQVMSSRQATSSRYYRSLYVAL